MTDADREKFAAILAALGEFASEPISQLRAELYFDALSDLTIEQVEQAARLYMRTGRFFPKPIELRELLEGSQEDQAAIAWNVAVEAHRRCGDTYSVALGDGAIGVAIKTVFGGWLEFCDAMHQVWGTDEVSYEDRETARLERREAEGRRRLISGLSDEMVASKRKEFLVAYRTAKRSGQKINYFAGQCEVSNRISAGSWTRGELGEVYSQRVFVAHRAGGYFLDAAFDRATGGLIGGIERLLQAAPPVKQLAPPPTKYLPPAPDELPTIEESQKAYHEGFKLMRERMKMPEPHRSMSPEEIAERARELREQLKRVEPEEQLTSVAGE